MSLIMCHVYDWYQQKTLIINGVPGIYTKMCSPGFFIYGIRTKTDYSGIMTTDERGLTAMDIRCKNPLNGAKENDITVINEGGDGWSDYTGSGSKYLCGANIYSGSITQTVLGIGSTDNVGICLMDLAFCEFNCNGAVLFQNQIPDQIYYISIPTSADEKLSDTRLYRQTTRYYGKKFQDHYSMIGQFGDSSDCTITDFFVKAENIRHIYSDPYNKIYDIWSATTNNVSNSDLMNGISNFLEINTDPINESIETFQFECFLSNRENPTTGGVWVLSNKFLVSIFCPNDINPFVVETDALIQSRTQIMEASSTKSSWPYFEFPPFLTKSKACPVKKYWISAMIDPVKVPYGIQDQNIICETDASTNQVDCNSGSGNVFTTKHRVNVLNGENPMQYNFMIRLIVKGYQYSYQDQYVWFPRDTSIKYKLIVVCPPSIAVYASSSFTHDLSTFLGATGANAIFTFSPYISSLPKCQRIIAYSISYIWPSTSGLSYPAISCLTDPCTMIDIDTSQTADIYFQINFQTQTDAGVTSQSSNMRVQIFATAQTPTITVAAMTEQTFLLDQVAFYSFDAFTCSTADCKLSYAITSSNSESLIPFITDWDRVTISNTGKLQFSVDTSSLASQSYFVFSRITAVPQVFQFSSLFLIQIKCGSEVISQPQWADYFFRGPYALSSGSYFIWNFRNQIYSDKILCPLIKYTGSASLNLLLKNQDDIIKSQVQILTDKPYRDKIKIYGHSALVQSLIPVEIEVVVCGNEEIRSSVTTEQNVLLQQGDFKQFDFSSWFQCSFSIENCHADCCEQTYQLYAGKCEDGLIYDATKYNFDTELKLITVKTTQGFEQEQICLRVTTKGLETADQIIKVEICGNEIINVANTTIISKIYKRSSIVSSKSISIDSNNYNFESTRTNCQVSVFKLLQTGSSGVSEYLGSDLILTGNSNTLMVEVKVSEPIEFSIYLAGYSQSLNSYGFIQINVIVCGHESLTTKGSLVGTYRIRGASSRILIYNVVFEDYFINNNTAICPLDSYTAIYEKGQNIILNPLISKYIEISQLGIYVDTQISEEDMVKFVQQGYASSLDSDLLFHNLSVEATTIGLVKAYLPVKLTLASLKTTINFAPEFEKDLSTIFLTKVVGTSVQYYDSVLPKIIDIEGDKIKDPMFHNVPDFVQYFKKDQNWVARINFEKVTEYREANVKIILSDILGNSRTKIHNIHVDLEQDENAENFESFVISASSKCFKIQKILSYTQICENNNEVCDLIVKKSMTFENYDQLENALFDEFQAVANHTDNGENIAKFAFVQNWETYFSLVETIYGQTLELQTVKDGTIGWSSTIQVLSWDEIEKKAFVCSNTISIDAAAIDLYTQELLDVKAKKYQIGSQNNSKIGSPVSVGGQVDTTSQFIEQFVAPPTFTQKIYQDPVLDKIILEIQFSQDMTVPDSLEGQDSLITQILQIKMRSAIDKLSSYVGTFNDSRGVMYGQILEPSNEQYSNLINLQFTWSIYSFEKNNLKLELIFAQKYKISQTPYGYDQVVFKFNGPEKFLSIGKQPQGFPEEFLKEFEESIKPIYNQATADAIGQVFDAAITTTKAVISVVFALGVLGGPLKKLWALIQSQQLSVHLILMNVLNVPGNAFVFQELITIINFRNKSPEVRQYISDKLECSETESIIENFERLDYKGTNFIKLVGSILINLVQGLLVLLIFNVINFYFKKNYKNVNKRGIWSKLFFLRDHIISFTAKLISQGYLEILIPLFISLSAFEVQKNNSGDKISQFTQYLMIAALVLPFAISGFIIRNFTFINVEVFQKKYGFLYKDLKTTTMLQANQIPIFMLRRIVFALAIVFMNEIAIVQFYIILYSNLAYMCYVLHCQPFIERDQNQMEVFNEIFIQIFTYLYMFFKQSFEPNLTIGWVYIILYFFNFVVNLKVLIQNAVFKTIPQTIRGAKKFLDEMQYQKRKNKYFDDREEEAGNKPESRSAQYMFQESKKIQARDIARNQLKQEMTQYEKEVIWMKLNNLPHSEIVMPRLEEESTALDYVDAQVLKDEQKLPIENMINRNCHYNRIIVGRKIILPPYNELDYIKLVDRFIIDYKLIDYEKPIKGLKLERLRKIIMIEKKCSLYRFLQKRRFLYISIVKDGNCGPRAIAARITGNQNGHMEVREKVCSELESQSYADRMRKDGTWFTDIEFQAAAKAYDIPIIVFSPLHKTAFFDCLFEANTPEGNKKAPMFILHNGKNHYSMLVGKKQKSLQKSHKNVLKQFMVPKEDKENHFQMQIIKMNKFLGIKTENIDLIHIELKIKEIGISKKKAEMKKIEKDKLKIVNDRLKIEIDRLKIEKERQKNFIKHRGKIAEQMSVIKELVEMEEVEYQLYLNAKQEAGFEKRRNFLKLK